MPYINIRIGTILSDAQKQALNETTTTLMNREESKRTGIQGIK